MRIWSLPVRALCDKHLLAEHKELHGIWTVIAQNRKGYANHPEVKRWNGHLCALADRHNEQRVEMLKRGFKHKSPLKDDVHPGDNVARVCRRTPQSWSTKEEQFQNLRRKGCACRRELLRRSYEGRTRIHRSA